jgi:alpha-glucosidase (family GH31 glycosyl hydrolase)
VRVDAPLDVLPLFARAGAIIFTADPRVLVLADATAPGVIDFASRRFEKHVWIVGAGEGLSSSSRCDFDGACVSVARSDVTIVDAGAFLD